MTDSENIVVVAGGTGLVGRYLCPLLERNGYLGRVLQIMYLQKRIVARMIFGQYLQ